MPTFVPILLLEGMRTVWMLISVMPTRTVSKRKQKNVDKILHQYYLYLFEPSLWNRCIGCRCIKCASTISFNVFLCLSHQNWSLFEYDWQIFVNFAFESQKTQVRCLWGQFALKILVSSRLATLHLVTMIIVQSMNYLLVNCLNLSILK